MNDKLNTCETVSFNEFVLNNEIEKLIFVKYEETPKFLFLRNEKQKNCDIVNLIIVNNKISKYSTICHIFTHILDSYINFYNSDCDIVLCYPQIKIFNIKNSTDIVNFLATINVTYEKENDVNIEQLENFIETYCNSKKYIENIKKITLEIVFKNKVLSELETKLHSSNIVCKVDKSKHIEPHIIIKNDINDFENFVMINNINIVLENRPDQIIFKMCELYNMFQRDTKNSNKNNLGLVVKTHNDIITHMDKTELKKYKLLANNFNEFVYYNQIKNTKRSEFNSYLKNLNIDHISCKKYSKMTKIKLCTTSEKIQKNIEKKSKDHYDEILKNEKFNEFYTTQNLTNWKDESVKKSCIGLLLNVHIENYNRTGKYIDNIFIIKSSDQNMGKIESAKKYLENLMNDENFDGTTHNTIIKENLFLPLYINDTHWKISREYIPLFMSLFFTNTTEMYSEQMINLYFVILINYFNYLTTIQDIELKKEKINIWIGLFRTCHQISIEMKYHKGLLNYIQSIEINNNNKIKNIQIIKMIGQILSCKIDTLTNNHKFKTILKKYSENTKNNNIDLITKGIDAIETIKKSLEIMKCNFEMFIKKIDENECTLPNELIDLFIKN